MFWSRLAPMVAGQGFDFDRAAERVGVVVGREGLADFQRADQAGRQHIQRHRAAARFRRWHQCAVDGDGVQVRAEAAHTDVAAFALIALDGHARQAGEGFGGVFVRQAADVVAADDADDVVGFFLGGDGVAQTGPLAADHHAVGGSGQFGAVGRFGGVGAAGQHGQHADGQGRQARCGGVVCSRFHWCPLVDGRTVRMVGGQCFSCVTGEGAAGAK
jgi:hypothetical protein